MEPQPNITESKTHSANLSNGKQIHYIISIEMTHLKLFFIYWKLKGFERFKYKNTKL